MTYQEIEKSIRNKVMDSDNTYKVLFLEASKESKLAPSQITENPIDEGNFVNGVSLIDAIKACIHSSITKNMQICKIGSYWDYELQAMFYDVRV